MEMFQAPLEEVRERFTLSEIVLMGWRSQEQAYKMHLRLHPEDEEEQEQTEEPEWDVRRERKTVKTQPKNKKRKRKQYDGHVPDGLPDRFYDEEGEVNLSKVKLNDAVKYLNGMGFKFPFMGRGRLA